jgi:hypothetical protein
MVVVLLSSALAVEANFGGDARKMYGAMLTFANRVDERRTSFSDFQPI